MKKKNRFSLFLLSCVLAVVLSGMPTPVMAASMSFPKKIQANIISGNAYADYYKVQNLPKNGKISSVKISNPKLADVTIYKKKWVRIVPKEYGTATITVKVKYGSKSKTFRSKLNAVNYISPVKSLIVNGEKVPSSEIGADRVFTNTNVKGETKFRVKAKAGWIVTGKKRQRGYAGEITTCTTLVLRFYNKKMKLTEEFAILFVDLYE